MFTGTYFALNLVDAPSNLGGSRLLEELWWIVDNNTIQIATHCYTYMSFLRMSLLFLGFLRIKGDKFGHYFYGQGSNLKVGTVTSKHIAVMQMVCRTIIGSLCCDSIFEWSVMGMYHHIIIIACSLSFQQIWQFPSRQQLQLASFFQHSSTGNSHWFIGVQLYSKCMQGLYIDF